MAVNQGQTQANNSQAGTNDQATNAQYAGGNNNGTAGQFSQPQSSNTNGGFRTFGANKISRSAAIESVNQFMELGQKVIDNNGQSQEYKLVRIPDERTRIPLPVIALYKTFSVAGKAVTIVRPIIYGTEQLAARKTSGGNNGFGYTNEVEVESAPGDAYTNQLWDAITNFLRSACGVVGEIYDASCFAIPQHFVPDEAKMTVIIANAVTMIESWANIRVNPTMNEINPSFFAEGKTEARMDFNPKPIMDSVGNPIRADWAVAITYQENGQAGSAHDFTNTRTPVVTVYGYIDVVLTNGAFQQNWVNPAFQQLPPPYTPMLVITHMETSMGLLTPAMVLLGLHGTTAIIDNGNFTRTFRPKVNTKMKRLVASLALEVPQLNLPGVTGIPDLSAADDVFFNFIGRAISRSPIIAIDIEETGDNNTVLNLIRWAASNDNASAKGKAVEVLTKSANILTGGNFASVAQRNQLVPDSIAQSDNNRIALGHYVADGAVYDRREVDKIAMLTTIGQTDMSTVNAFDESMNNTAIPVETRLAQNWQIVNSCLQTVSPVAGYARRILLNGKFLSTINESIRTAGINVVLNGGQFDGQTQRGRDYAAVNAMAYTATAGQFSQQSAWAGAGNGQGFGARNYAGW